MSSLPETSLLSVGSKDLVGAKMLRNEPRWLRKGYALLDNLEVNWPTVIVYTGAVLELVQLSALIFTKAYTWGPLLQLMGSALQCTILPLWSTAYVLTATYPVNIIFVVLVGIAVMLLYFFLLLEYRKIDTQRYLQYPKVTKSLLYLLIGPLFLPCLQLLLAFCVCTGDHGSAKSNYLAEFLHQVCLGRQDAEMIAMFSISLIIILLLFIPKLIITLAVYEDDPLSENVRARSHSMVEVGHLVFISLISVLGHYLPSVGEPEAFAGIFAAFSFVMAALHVFFIPFYDVTMNRIRVIGYSVLFFSGLLLIIEMSVGPSSPIYGANNLDIAVLLPGALVIAIITHGLSHFRVSSRFLRDIARARHGEIHAEKFKRRMFFPFYLPTAETHWFHTNGAVLNARNNVFVKSLDGTSGIHSGFASVAMNSSSFSPKNSSVQPTDSSFIGNASRTSVAHRDIDEMNKFEMSCYLDSILLSTDVELATRFLIFFYRVTETRVPEHLLEFGMGIYNKGLNRFVQNPWLKLQFATFLCTYYSKTNHVSLALCEDLQYCQLGPILAYRLHRRANIVSDQRIRRTQAAAHYFQQAFRIHKETIVHMQLFWKRMASERVDISMLAQTSLTIISGCQRGGRYYRMAMQYKANPNIISRYAQFIEDVVLDPESADYAREIAADMTMRLEDGTPQKDVQNDGILISQKKLGRQYGRISRNLRFFLFTMFVIIFLLLIGICVIIGYTYNRGGEVMAGLFTACQFRYNAFRTIWLAELSRGLSETDSLWDYLEDSLTELRRVFAELTYGEYQGIMKEYQHISSENSLKVIYAADQYPIGSAGFWRAGEVLIDALESLVLYRTNPLTREASYTLLKENSFYGLVEVFNSSIDQLQSEASTLLKSSLVSIIALYVAVLLCVLFTFFVFRYYLSRISGVVMMALNLFCLIPRNALASIAKDLGDKLEHFEDPDAGVERKLRERKEEGLSEKFADVEGNLPGMGGGGRNDRSFDVGNGGGSLLGGLSSGMGNGSADRPGSNQTLGENGGVGTMLLGSRGTSQETVERSGMILGMPGSGVSGGHTSGVMGVGGPTASSTQMKSNPWKDGEDGQVGGGGGAGVGGLGSKFDLLARNSSVADVGRIKMHMGQYEAPYQKGYFTPRQLSEKEAKAREDHINEVELETNLASIRAKKEAIGGGGSSGAGTDQVEEAASYTPPITLNSSIKLSQYRLTLGLTVLAICVAIPLAVLDFFLMESLFREHGTNILLLEDVNLFEQNMYSFVSDLETFSFLASKTLGTETTADFYTLTSDSLSTTVGNASSFTEGRFSIIESFSNLRPTGALGNFQIFDFYLRILISQLMASGKLACSSFVPPTSSRPLDCSFFSTEEYTSSLFYPNETESVLFSTSLELPTTWEADSALDKPVQAQIAMNVMLSPYYEYVFNETFTSWKLVREEILSYLRESASFDSSRIDYKGKPITLGLSIVLGVLVLFICLQTGINGSNSFSFVCFLIATGCAFAGVVVHAILFTSPLPYDGPLKDYISVLSDMSDINTLITQAQENAKQCAFAGNWNGIVLFATTTAPNLFASWNDLFERAGIEYFTMLTTAYTAFQTCFYLLTISLRLSISFLGMPDAFEDLPVISNCEWDLEKETYGVRLQEMYDGTPQILYSTKAADLALPVNEQKDLVYSLIAGPWGATALMTGKQSLNTVLSGYVNSQLQTIESRYNLHYPLLLTSVILSLIVIFISIVVVVFIGIFLLQMKQGRKNARQKYSPGSQAYDRALSTVVRWSSFFIVMFMMIFTVVTVIYVVHNLDLIDGFHHINILNLREVRLFKSDLAISKSIKESRFMSSAMLFANSAIESAMEYNSVVDLRFFANVPRLLFGGVDNITNVRYLESYAVNSSLTSFEEESPVLAFEHYVNPSMYRWRQRVLEMTTLSPTTLQIQQKALRSALSNLSSFSFASTETVYNDLQRQQTLWLCFQIALLLISFLMLCVGMLYMVLYVVGQLREKEEGTQVVLQMIPRSIRQAIPAISFYMGTGRMAEDSNALEIDQMSKDLSVIPIVTINTEGKIRQFSRAAEESFLWTRGEAIGQSVSILMPDNIAEEHDQYVQNYLKTGVKYMIGNSRPIRAKRKDGTLFPALIEVMEYHNGTELLFVSAIHVSQEALELEKSCELSQSLTDASIIPIVVIDSDGIIQLFSKGGEEAFKTTADDMVGQKVNMLMPRQEAELHDSYLERYFRSKSSAALNKPRYFRGKRMNGEIFPIRIIIKELQIAGRCFFVGYIEDLTARLRLEMVAAAGEIMQEESPVPMIVTDMEGCIRQCSKSIYKLCGIPRSELLQRHIHSLVRSDNVLDLVEKVKSNPRGFQMQTYDFHIDEFPVVRITEEGGEETFQARIVSRLFQWHTKGMHLMLFLEDLTLVQTLDLNCRIGNAVMGMSAIPIIVVREDGIIKQMSAAAEQAFHCFASDMYHKKIDLLFQTSEGCEMSSEIGSSVTRPRDGVKGFPKDGEKSDEDDSLNGMFSFASLNLQQRILSQKNPVAQVLEEYQKSGSLGLCGRKLHGVGTTVDYGTPFPVEVIVVKVGEEYGDEELFVVYIRNTEEDHRLLEVTRWNDAFMAIVPIATVCVSLDSKIFACSDSTCEHFGWKKEELIGENISVLMPSYIAADHERYMQQYRDLLETSFKEGVRKNILNRRTVSFGCNKNGKEFPVIIMLRDVHIEGADSFLIASIRLAHQDVALESLGKVSSTMSAISPCPFISINAEGIVTEFSRSAQHTFGYSELEVIGQNIKMLQTPDVASMHDGYLRAYEKTGVKRLLDQETSVIARKKDGSLLNIDLMVKEIRSEYSLEFVGYLKDVSIKKSGKQMHALNELIDLEAAFPMVEVDGYGLIKDVRYLEKEFGYSAEELVGKNILELLPEPLGGFQGITLAHQSAQGASTVGNSLGFTTADGRTKSSRSWIEQAVDELLELRGGPNEKGRGQLGGGSHPLGPSGGGGGGAHSRQTQWVSRRLLANRKNKRKLWCEVVLGELIRPEDPLVRMMAAVNKDSSRKGGKRNSGAAFSENKKKERREEKRILVYLRNLDQEVMLELYEGINYTATDLYPIPLITMSLEGRITLLNRAAEETFAYLAKDTIGELFTSYLFQSEQPRFEEALGGLRENAKQGYSRGEKTLEELVVRRKGSSGPLRMSTNLRLVKGSGKNTDPYILATFCDTSSEVAVSTEEALSKVLMSDSIIPSILTDHMGKIMIFSSGAETLFGYSKIELEGRNVGVIPCYVQSLEEQVSLPGSMSGAESSLAPGKKVPLDFLRTRMNFTSNTTLPISIQENVVIMKKNGEKVFSLVHLHSIMPYKKKLPLFIAYFQDQKMLVRQERPLQLFMSLMESSLSGVLVIAAHGVVLRGNKTAWSLLGYTKEELVNLPVSVLLPVDKPGSTALLLAIRYVMKATEENKLTSSVQKEVTDGELVGKDGKSTEVHAIVASVLPSAGGEHMRVVINFIHIAGKKKAKVFEDRESFLDDISGGMVFEIDLRQQKIIHVNKSFLNVLEYGKAADVVGQKWESFVPNGDERLRTYLTKVLESSEKKRERFRTDDAQLTVVGSSGKSVKVTGKIRSLERRNGTVCSLLGIFHPVSLSKTQSSQLVMTAVNQSDCAMLLCTVDGTILSTNEKVYELFSIPSKSSLIGTRLANLFPAESQEATLSRFERLVVEGWTQVIPALRFPNRFGGEDPGDRPSDAARGTASGRTGEVGSSQEPGKGAPGILSTLRLIMPDISDAEWEKKRGSSEPDRTMMVEIKLETIRADGPSGGGGVGGGGFPLGGGNGGGLSSGGSGTMSMNIGGFRTSIGARGSGRSSEPSNAGFLDQRSQSHHSSLLLVRLRAAERQHQESLLLSAMKALLEIQELATFTIDATGIIRSWSPRAHQFFFTPDPVGSNICDTVLTPSSGGSFRELLQEYCRNRTLAVLQQVTLTANVYTPPPSSTGNKGAADGKWLFFGNGTGEDEDEVRLSPVQLGNSISVKGRKGESTILNFGDALNKRGIFHERKSFTPTVVATVKVELICKEAKGERRGSIGRIPDDLLCYIRKIDEEIKEDKQ